jgi:hypothetical protein
MFRDNILNQKIFHYSKRTRRKDIEAVFGIKAVTIERTPNIEKGAEINWHIKLHFLADRRVGLRYRLGIGRYILSNFNPKRVVCSGEIGRDGIISQKELHDEETIISYNLYVYYIQYGEEIGVIYDLKEIWNEQNATQKNSFTSEKEFVSKISDMQKRIKEHSDTFKPGSSKKERNFITKNDMKAALIDDKKKQIGPATQSKSYKSIDASILQHIGKIQTNSIEAFKNLERKIDAVKDICTEQVNKSEFKDSIAHIVNSVIDGLRDKEREKHHSYSKDGDRIKDELREVTKNEAQFLKNRYQNIASIINGLRQDSQLYKNIFDRGNKLKKILNALEYEGDKTAADLVNNLYHDILKRVEFDKVHIEDAAKMFENEVITAIESDHSITQSFSIIRFWEILNQVQSHIDEKLTTLLKKYKEVAFNDEKECLQAIYHFIEKKLLPFVEKDLFQIVDDKSKDELEQHR